jgi:hypothetical protein
MLRFAILTLGACLSFGYTVVANPDTTKQVDLMIKLSDRLVSWLV